LVSPNHHLQCFRAPHSDTRPPLTGTPRNCLLLLSVAVRRPRTLRSLSERPAQLSDSESSVAMLLDSIPCAGDQHDEAGVCVVDAMEEVERARQREIAA